MGSSSASGAVASVSVSPPPSVSCGKGFLLGVFAWGFCLGVSADFHYIYEKAREILNPPDRTARYNLVVSYQLSVKGFC